MAKSKDEDFHPNYRDMSESNYLSRKKVVHEKRAKAFYAKRYRERNPDKMAAYNRQNPMLRIRLPLELHQALKERFGDHIQDAIRELIRAELAEK